MRLLLISYWYYPEPVTKPHDFASELVRRGHQVTVITTFPNYPGGQVYDGYKMSLWQRESIDGVDVLRVPVIINRSRSAKQRVLSYTSFAFVAVLLGLFLVHRPDLIWNYQLGLPGILLGKLLGSPVIHEVQDLWPEWGRNADMGIGGLFYWLLDMQERIIYRNAHAITTISNGFKKALVAKKIKESKISVFPNWANECYFHPVPLDSELSHREGLSGHFNVIYGGNVGTAQALHVVLEAATLLRDQPDIQFVIVGDGVERESLEQQALRDNLTNVRFLGGCPLDQMARYLMLADVLLVHLKQNAEYTITIPSKTYSYLAMGKPIIVAAAGDVTDLVQDFGVGVVCPPEDASSLAEAVRLLYSKSADERKSIGEKSRDAFLTYFTRQVLVDQYEALFQQLVA